MQWILPAGCLLVLAVLVCGCVQSPPGVPVTAAATGTVPATVLPDTVPAAHPRMAVNVTADQTATEVVVQVTGGEDADQLVLLTIRITNRDGTTSIRTIPDPLPGKPYRFPYRGYANAARINIVGAFSDGYQQTLLMTSL